MKKAILNLILLGLLGGCSSLNEVHTLPLNDYLEIRYSELDKIGLNIIKRDVENLWRVPKEFWNRHGLQLALLKKIDFSPINCTPHQLACTFRNQSESQNTIYLRPNYLYYLNPLERLLTLIHELYHLNFAESVDHVGCKDALLANIGDECDDNLRSAYGIEYYYLIQILRDTRSKEYVMVRQRINSL